MPHQSATFESGAWTTETSSHRARQAEGEGHVIGRKVFAKISAVEGTALDKAAKDAFAEFDRQGLPHEGRRRAIIGRFTRHS